VGLETKPFEKGSPTKKRWDLDFGREKDHFRQQDSTPTGSRNHPERGAPEKTSLLKKKNGGSYQIGTRLSKQTGLTWTGRKVFHPTEKIGGETTKKTGGGGKGKSLRGGVM